MYLQIYYYRYNYIKLTAIYSIKLGCTSFEVALAHCIRTEKRTTLCKKMCDVRISERARNKMYKIITIIGMRIKVNQLLGIR